MINTKNLTSMNSVLSEKYGEEGTATRTEFNAKAQAWYLAEVLKEERKRRKISQSQLAEIVGSSKNTISSIETGQFCPTAYLAALLCVALDCKFEEMFYFEEE
mgnify:CR=1 FL=1